MNNVHKKEIKRLETEKQFKELLVEEGYIPLFDKYVNGLTKVLIQHEVCGNEYSVTPEYFKKGDRCRKCRSIRNRIPFSQIKTMIETNTNNEYTLLSTETKNNFDKISILHNNCNTEYLGTPACFKRGQRCPICSFKEMGFRKRNSFFQIKTMIEANTNNEYTLLSTEVKTNKDKIEILHNKCKTIYFGTPSGFQQGKRCRKCAIVESGLKRKKSLEIYSKIIEEGTDNEYKIISNENNLYSHTIHLLHTKCNTEYTVSMSNFKKGCRCPYCANLATESKGVSLIKDILNYLNIYYLQEYKFKECKNYRSLPFDFYVPLKNNKYLLIEYDGKQHFKSWNNMKEQLNVQQLRDNIKNQYCLENNIPLLRIPYTDKNIEETLITFLEEYEDLLIFK